VKEAYDADFLIKMNTQNCSFFDTNFFVKKFDEVHITSLEQLQSSDLLNNLTNYNVSVQAIQVDWIINKPEGQLFL
jgi:hypothetical protein